MIHILCSALISVLATNPVFIEVFAFVFLLPAV